MGMFDYLHINRARLPISNEDQERLKDKVFQTKSVQQSLANIYITDDGYLECLAYKYLANIQLLYNEESGNELPKRVRFTDAHGVLLFYTSTDDNERFKFMAFFTEGRLTSLKRADGQWIGGDATVYWSEEIEV